MKLSQEVLTEIKENEKTYKIIHIILNDVEESVKLAIYEKIGYNTIPYDSKISEILKKKKQITNESINEAMELMNSSINKE